MPKLIIGLPPRGKDYFGQESFIKNLWEKLETNNILLTAPRRFGKTAAMYNLLDKPKEPFKPIYINVEPTMSASNFVLELIAILLKNKNFSEYVVNILKAKTKGVISTLKNSISKIDIGALKVELKEKTDIENNWFEYKEKLIFLFSMSDKPLLLMIDEFPIMINNLIEMKREKEAEQFLRWFRTIRTYHTNKSKFIIAGSINLVSTLNSINLVDTINDLYIQKLNPFDLKTAKDFIKAVSQNKNINISEELIIFILNLVGTPIPYLLSVFLQTVFDKIEMTGSTISQGLIYECFYEELLGGTTSLAFQHYRARLSQYYQKAYEEKAAKKFLNILSLYDKHINNDELYRIFLETTNLVSSDKAEEEFKELMYKLENDFYIKNTKEGYIFYSNVLRLWWKTNYGYQG
jgi:uncharacterized protein